MTEQSNWRARRGWRWAVVGAVVLLLGVIALVVALFLVPRDDDHRPEPTPAPSSSAATPSVPPAEAEVVDESVIERGWRPEPITEDPEVYVRAALEAASTFDTQLSSRDEWLAWLSTWFTPPPYYDSAAERDDAQRGFLSELRTHVVLPAPEWESLQRENGNVVAEVEGDVAFFDDPQFEQLGVYTGTADVVLTHTRDANADGSEQVSYQDRVRVSVQVQCGQPTEPAPGSAQRSGHCKVVRFFTEPLG